MDDDLRLDGNAAAGLLGEIFAVDLTAARCCCGGCGATEQLAAEAVYAAGPGNRHAVRPLRPYDGRRGARGRPLLAGRLRHDLARDPGARSGLTPQLGER